MRALFAVTLLAACNRTAEPREGAFAIEDVARTTSTEARISVARRAVPLEAMAMGRWLAGLPMRGMAEVKVELAAPVKDGRTLFSQARGTFAFACEASCRIGDDNAPLAFRGQTLDIGHLDLDALALRGTVENGHAKLTHWELASPDVKLTVDLDIALDDDLAASTIDGCIRFAPGEGLDKRRPKTWAVLKTTGATADASGMFTIRLAGTLGAPKRLAQACGGPAVAND